MLDRCMNIVYDYQFAMVNLLHTSEGCKLLSRQFRTWMLLIGKKRDKLRRVANLKIHRNEDKFYCVFAVAHPHF